MVRDALAMLRLLNAETRDDPQAPVRRQQQRDGGDTIWGIRQDLIADDLRGVLESPGDNSAKPLSDDDPLSDYDTPIPMVGQEGEPDDEDTELTVRLIG